jgi:hypothetical protein
MGSIMGSQNIMGLDYGLSVQFKMGRGPFICLDRGVGKGVRIGEIGYRVRLLGLANIHTHRIHH